MNKKIRNNKYYNQVKKYIKYIISIPLFPIAAIILMVYGIFYGIYYIATLIFNKDISKNSIKKSLGRIKKHIDKIPNIILLPIATVISLLHHAVRLVYDLIEGNLNRFESNRNSTQRLIRQAISSVVRGETNLLNSFSRRKVTKLFTALLQIISAITTYAGFTFFLGNLNPVAPLMITIVIQGGCYFLLNYSSTHKHAGIGKRRILLILLIVISIVTSYIGVFNSTAQPINYMKNAYSEFQVYNNELIDSKLLENEFQKFDSVEISKNFSAFSGLVIDAKAKVSEAQEIIDTTPTSTTSNDRYLDNNGRFHNTTSTVIVTENEKIVRAQRALKAELESNISKLQSYTNNSNNTEDNVYNAYIEIIKNSELLKDSTNTYTKVYNDFQGAIEDAKNLQSALNNTTYIIQDLDITEIIVRNNKSITLSNLKLEDYDKLTSDQLNKTAQNSTLYNIYNYFESINKVVASEDLINAEKIKNIVNEKINDNCSKLSNYLTAEERNTLYKMREQTIIPNTQVLPFYLAKKDFKNYFGYMIISAIIAILVDGISAFISYALLPRRKSSLYYDKVEKMYNIREEMVEDCLMYICMEEIGKNPGLFNNENINEITNEIASIIFNVMDGFLKKAKLLYLPIGLNAYGYYSEDVIEQFSEYEKRLFITMCNISMIQPFHKSELLPILNSEFSTSKDNTEKADSNLINRYGNLFKDDTIYYCISRNLHVWFCDSFSELLENALFISEINPDSSENSQAIVLKDSNIGGENND